MKLERLAVKKSHFLESYLKIMPAMPKSCSLLYARFQVILQIRKMTHMQGSDKHCEAMPLNNVYHRIHCVLFFLWNFDGRRVRVSIILQIVFVRNLLARCKLVVVLRIACSLKASSFPVWFMMIQFRIIMIFSF